MRLPEVSDVHHWEYLTFAAVLTVIAGHVWSTNQRKTFRVAAFCIIVGGIAILIARRSLTS